MWFSLLLKYIQRDDEGCKSGQNFETVSGYPIPPMVFQSVGNQFSSIHGARDRTTLLCP
jgi:hypothetical protein